MIVDEEKELVKQRERERAVEICGLKIRQEKAGSSRVVAPHDGSRNAGGSNAKLEVSNKLNADPNEYPPGRGWGSGPGRSLGPPNMVAMSRSTSCPSSNTVGDRKKVQDEGEGYFSTFVSQPPMTFGLRRNEEVGMGESGLESVFSPRPIMPVVFPPSATPLQRPRHSLLDARFGKRSTSPSDYFMGGGGTLENDFGLFKRPSVKRKQPSGEAGEIMTRKRAQNESSSRELGKEKELERRFSNGGGHSHPREGVLDVLTSSLVR
jgi:hypothetical protein